jgi:hypothetical protein
MGSKEPKRERLQEMARVIDRALTRLGLGLEQSGERAMRLARGLVRNPSLTLAFMTVVLFALARFPTEVFYSELGVRPEDVGFNSVQVLLQGSAVLLVFSLGIALCVVAAFFVIFWIASSVLASENVPISRIARTAFRLSLFPILVLTIALALWLLVDVAERQGDDVRAGQGISPGLYPWRAEQVKVTWRRADARPLPGCRQLFFLGEANNRVVLYDASRATSYRISAEDIELEFPLDCP